MSDPIKLQILKAITAHLENITPENGYNHRLTGSVFRGRAIIGAQTALPCLSILENPKAAQGQWADEDLTVRKDQWGLLVQGWVEDDEENPTDALYPLVEDVVKRLGDINNSAFPGIYRLKGLISELQLHPAVCRPAEDGISSKAFFYMPITIGLTTHLI